ncbi:hypothetical protein LIER_43829 [Lithospermum erythrorhizon]|uniref:Uncharacterized protein n=1 Tax=Lithospermum erythrorhizon TaxID=34254 RepID=A0AAV3R137_LITER
MAGDGAGEPPPHGEGGGEQYPPLEVGLLLPSQPLSSSSNNRPPPLVPQAPVVPNEGGLTASVLPPQAFKVPSSNKNPNNLAQAPPPSHHALLPFDGEASSSDGNSSEPQAPPPQPQAQTPNTPAPKPQTPNNRRTLVLPPPLKPPPSLLLPLRFKTSLLRRTPWKMAFIRPCITSPFSPLLFSPARPCLSPANS